MTVEAEPQTSPTHGTFGKSPSKPVPLAGYVGFDSITTQIKKKFLKRGFQLNIMLVGESGLGKSTFVNTLFSAHLLNSKGRTQTAQPNRKTTSIESVTHNLNENGVNLRLTIVDTPGYGDQINNDNCWEPIISYIKEQHNAYLTKELSPNRERIIDDSRIHLCLFFVPPTGHALKPMDILVLQELIKVVNVVPVIAKSDGLTPLERKCFKKRIQSEIAFHGIELYPYDSPEDNEEDRVSNQTIRKDLPFAVIGSELMFDVDGVSVRGRRTRWGLINIEDPNHCEFVQLREFLTRSHLQDLIETTHFRHYESFRVHQLKNFKENKHFSISSESNFDSSTQISVARPRSPVRFNLPVASARGARHFQV